MKRIVVACAGLLALACAEVPAAGADFPPYQAPRPVYSPGYYWTGFYLGINGGGGWGTSQWDGVDQFDVSGGLIGGTIGYNWQVNQIVLGAEGDIDWSGIKGTTTVLCPAGCETRNKWLVTARGRIGYAFDRFLPYITGGLAAGDINATRPGFPGGSNSNAGWTAGLGLEVGVVSNVSVKAEYLYLDLGDFNCGLNCALAPTGNTSFNANLFRGGLNVRF
ncbi:MAG TPA: outer membrane protein [Xanthobacteraceae bacterium]|jgi:outer membrane immunogenic protein